MDLKTYLTNLIIVPKPTTIVDIDTYKYPEKIINFLYMIRDRYDFKTTFNAIGTDSGIPSDLLNFLAFTIISYPTKDIVLNRVKSVGIPYTYLEAGVSKTGFKSPLWWSSINGTDVLSLDTVPSSDDVISIINDVLAGAYGYYTQGIVNPSKNTWSAQGLSLSPYIKVFTSGKITLDFLKAIQVRDRILATDKGKDLSFFPAFLIYNDSLLSVDPYDSNYLRVDSATIKASLASAINYIETQLFAQDIALLNTLCTRFDQSIDVNNQAKAKLDSEQAKFDKISSDLDATLLEAKKIYTVYDILSQNLQNKPDPVVAYQAQLQAQMDNELSIFQTQETARLSKIAIDKQASDLQSQLEAQKNAALTLFMNNQLDAAKQKAQAEATYQAQLAASASLRSTNDVLSLSNTSLPEVPIIPSVKLTQAAVAPIATKTSVAVPVVAGLGVLAWLALGGKN